jgi:hypothetical protein
VNGKYVAAGWATSGNAGRFDFYFVLTLYYQSSSTVRHIVLNVTE